MVREKDDIGIDASDRNGRTALIWASECGHEKVVRILLDAGADVNAQGGEYASALQAASARIGDFQIHQQSLCLGLVTRSWWLASQRIGVFICPKSTNNSQPVSFITEIPRSLSTLHTNMTT